TPTRSDGHAKRWPDSGAIRYDPRGGQTDERLFPVPSVLDISSRDTPMFVASNPSSVVLTPLAGRERELADLLGLIRRAAAGLVTVSGPGGVGKTRLALQVAAEAADNFADGVAFVRLDPIRDPALVVTTVAQALGLREAGNESWFDRLTS